jgi:hypothetical protein
MMKNCHDLKSSPGKSGRSWPAGIERIMFWIPESDDKKRQLVISPLPGKKTVPVIVFPIVKKDKFDGVQESERVVQQKGREIPFLSRRKSFFGSSENQVFAQDVETVADR